MTENRGTQVDDDITPVRLKPGWNTLLLKIGNGGGAWGFTARLTDKQGMPVEGLRFATRPS